ncbi:MAG: hypothetical protein M3P33_01325 [bacterium]|nr:hypothetical protein [bacterium]
MSGVLRDNNPSSTSDERLARVVQIYEGVNVMHSSGGVDLRFIQDATCDAVLRIQNPTESVYGPVLSLTHYMTSPDNHSNLADDLLYQRIKNIQLALGLPHDYYLNSELSTAINSSETYCIFKTEKDLPDTLIGIQDKILKYGLRDVTEVYHLIGLTDLQLWKIAKVSAEPYLTAPSNNIVDVLYLPIQADELDNSLIVGSYNIITNLVSEHFPKASELYDYKKGIIETKIRILMAYMCLYPEPEN